MLARTSPEWICPQVSVFPGAGSASITASALSSKTSPLGWRLDFSRAFPLVGFVLGSNRPRLASSNLTVERWGSTTHLCDPAARFHHHGRRAP
jgi:hypothetical protein